MTEHKSYSPAPNEVVEKVWTEYRKMYSAMNNLLTARSWILRQPRRKPNRTFRYDDVMKLSGMSANTRQQIGDAFEMVSKFYAVLTNTNPSIQKMQEEASALKDKWEDVGRGASWQGDDKYVFHRYNKIKKMVEFVYSITLMH